MFTIRKFALFLIVTIVILVGGIGVQRKGSTLAAPQTGITSLAPPLEDFIHIWTGDGVDNLAPAVAYNSLHDEYLVVWENDRGATHDIYARRVSGDGQVLSWFTIVSNANYWNWLPDVAYNPVADEYLVVYTYNSVSTGNDIWGRRVAWNGSSMSTEIPIAVDAGSQWYPAVDYNSQNDEYLVVYENDWGGGLRDIAAQRVDADGALLSWRNIASDPNTVRRLPDVAYNAAQNEYLIAYTYDFPTDGDIWGKVASANLGTLGAEIFIVDNTNNQDGVSLAAGPNEYLAVWEDGPQTATERTIYSRRVSATGALSPLIPIATHTGEFCIEPAVAYSPIFGYLITWRYVPTTGVWDLYGRYVNAGQDLVSSDEFVIDDDPHAQKSPALDCSTAGDCLVVEEDNSSMTGPVDYEIRGRLVRPFQVFIPVISK